MAERNMVLQLLLTAKDEMSTIIGKAFGFLDRTTSASANFVREKLSNLFGGSTESAQDFEAALARVKAKADATDEEMAQLKKAAQAAAVELKLGADGATQSAVALEYLTGAGLSVKQSIGALPSVLRIAKNEQISTQAATESLVNAMSVMGVAFDDSGRAADVLQKAAKETQTSVFALSQAIITGGGSAARYGYTLEQTTAILMAFAKGGIQGSAAGTALANVLNDIANPASKARQEMAKFGVSTGDVRTFIGKLIELGPRGIQVMRGFSEEAGPGLAALLKVGIQGLDQFGQSLEKNAIGSLERTSNTIGNTTRGALERLAAAWTQVKSTLAEPLLKPITEGAEALSKKLTELQSSGILESIGQGIATLFTDAGQVVSDFLGKVNWKDLKAEAGNTIAAIRTALDEMINGVQSKIQTVSDWTTTVFSPVTQAIDGYRLAWAMTNKDQAEAARLQAQIEARTTAIGRALTGTSSEYGKAAQAAQALSQKTSAAAQSTADLQTAAQTAAQKTRALAEAVKAQQTEVDRLNEANARGQASNEDYGLAVQKLWKAQADLKAAQTEQKKTQDALNASVTAAAPATQKAVQATEQLAEKTQAAEKATDLMAKQAARAGEAGRQTSIAWSKTADILPRIAEQHIKIGNGFGEVKRAVETANGPLREWSDATVMAADGAAKFSDHLGPIPQHLTTFAEKAAEVDRQVKAANNNIGDWREGLKLTAIQMVGLKDSAAAYAAKLALVEEAQRNGKATDKEVSEAKQQAINSQDRYNKALDEYIVQQERAVAAAQRATALISQQHDLDIQRKQDAVELAKIKGDQNEITRAENDLLDAQANKSQALIANKQQEIAAYKDAIDAVNLKLAADGELSEADQAQLAEMADKLAALGLEKKALEQNADALEKVIALKKESADLKALKESAKVFDNAAQNAYKFSDAQADVDRRNKEVSESAEKVKNAMEGVNVTMAKFGKQSAIAFGEDGIRQFELIVRDIKNAIDEAGTAAEKLANEGLRGVGNNASDAALYVENLANNLEQSESYLNDAARAASDNLRQALADARAEAEAMVQSLAEAADATEKEILRLQGKNKEVLNIEHQEKLRQLEEEYKRAGELGDAEYRRAKAAEEELHALKLKQLQEQAEADKKAKTSTTNTTSSSSSGGSGVSGGGTVVHAPITINTDISNLANEDWVRKNIMPTLSKVARLQR